MTTTAGGALVLSPLLVGSLSGKKAEAQEKAGRVIPFSLRVGILPGASYGVQREVWAYNGQVPGPLIRATEGDMLRIRVKNELARPTTIHWHGVHQIGTWRMDGVEGLTQAGIAPGAEFTYEFLAKPAGTHWYHSHAGVQYSEGLFAPLVIERREERSNYDRDEVLMINDWFRTPSDEILQGLIRGGAGERGGMQGMQMGGMAGMKMEEMADIADVPFEMGLINGRGRAPGDTKSPLSTFEVGQGQRVRFRIINASSTYAFRFQVDGHPLTVIAADGTPVKPVTVDNLLVSIGERYDVLVEGKRAGAYWIRAVTLDGKEVRAIFRTRGARPAEPRPGPVVWGRRALTLAMLRPLEPVNLARAPFREVTLQMGGNMAPYSWTINGQAYPQSSPIPVERGESIRLVLENPTEMDHPMHLHGHSFYVLGRPDRLNPTDPLLRDTVNVPARSTLVLQWAATNPGRWLFHCHIEWHLATGMASGFEYRGVA